MFRSLVSLVFLSTFHLTFLLAYSATASARENLALRIAVVNLESQPISMASMAKLKAVQSNCDNEFIPSKYHSINPLAVINTALKIWKVIESNRASSDVDYAYANALPSGVKCWTELENWHRPVGESITGQVKNVFRRDVVKFKLHLLYNYGGSFNGKGQYLANISVIPTIEKVAFGYDLNVDARVAKVVNIGTVDEPLASARVSITWLITGLNQVGGSAIYEIDGSGGLRRYK